MEHAIGIFVDRVVAAAHPVAITVGECDVKCEKPQHRIDVKNRTQRRFEFFGGRLGEYATEMDEVVPVRVAVFGVDLVALLVVLELVAAVVQSCGGLWRALYFPSSTTALEHWPVHGDELAIELLHARIHAPRFAVDHHLHEIRFGRREMRLRYLRVQHRGHERGIAVTVEKIERGVAVKLLF